MFSPHKASGLPVTICQLPAHCLRSAPWPGCHSWSTASPLPLRPTRLPPLGKCVYILAKSTSATRPPSPPFPSTALEPHGLTYYRLPYLCAYFTHCLVVGRHQGFHLSTICRVWYSPMPQSRVNYLLTEGRSLDIIFGYISVPCE